MIEKQAKLLEARGGIEPPNKGFADLGHPSVSLSDSAPKVGGDPVHPVSIQGRPLAIDLFCGLGGWAQGLLAEGYDVVGFDIERHVYGSESYPAQLVLQDVRSLHGSQFRAAAVIVASPPCQEYSYRAMPWKRAKALPPPSNALFEACFRIQREAIEETGRFIPLVVENVKGAQPSVGRAVWHYGSYYLWGNVPALMPSVRNGLKIPGQNWSKFSETGEVSPHWNMQAVKVPGQKYREEFAFTRGRKGTGGGWFSDLKKDGTRAHWKDSACETRRFNSKSLARKAASAQIAKIPFELARHIARVFKPTEAAA